MRSQTDSESKSTSKLRRQIFVLLLPAGALMIILMTAAFHWHFKSGVYGSIGEGSFLFSSLVIFCCTLPFLLLVAWALCRRLNSQAEEVQQRLLKRLEFERLISEISTDFVALGPGQTDTCINSTLASIGAFTGVDRVYLSILKEGGARIGQRYEWCAEGVERETSNPDNINLEEDLPWLADQICTQRAFEFADLGDLPPEARLEREHFESQGIQSLIAMPLLPGNRVIGYLGLDAVHEQRSWEHDDRTLLRLAGEIITHALEKDRAEEELHATNDRLASILDALPDLLFEVDSSGRIFYFRAPQPEKLFVPPQDFIDRLVPDILPEPAAGIAMDAIREVITTGRSEGAVYFLDMPTGKRWFELSGALIARGSQDRALALVRDITERVLAEEERHALERQVQHSQRLESLGVLAGGIAHDFNNILAAVLGYAELVMDDLGEKHPAWPDVMEINKSANRAAELTRQMLAYSGKGRFVVEAIDVSRQVDDIAQLLRTSIARSITLTLNLDRSLPAIKADGSQVQQVVMNLITNAAEAIGDVPGSISLTTGQLECSSVDLSQNLAAPASPSDAPQPGVYIYFDVSDSGCGMGEETKAKVFDPFFTTKFTGRGLGMAAVLGIMRGHDGAIFLETKLGEGSTFRVLFPVFDERVNDKDHAIPKEKKIDDGPECGTILVVDDEKQVLEMTTRMLKRLGFSVLCAADGREALEVFRRDHTSIDGVILDLTMPHMGGEACFDGLRRIKDDVLVILASGYNEQELSRRFAGKGMAGFIQKPFVMAVLKEKLEGVFGN